MKRLFQRRSQDVADLKAGPLRLVAITAEMMLAEQQRDLEHRELQRLLHARLTQEWPPEHWEPHVYEFILKQYEEIGRAHV